MPKTHPIPKYRKHKPSGQAVVTLNGRDHYLGPHRSQTSIAEYDRLIAEWLAGGRRLPEDGHASFTVNELIAAYWDHVTAYYVKDGQPTGEQHSTKASLRPVRHLYGHTQARDFGPLALKACRQWMIDAGWARMNINKRVGRICRMFKWAAENELLPAEVYHSLRTVSGLRKGRTAAPETEPVRPVSNEFVDAVRDHVARQVWAMIELQRLSGMRPGEVVLMRGCDLDTSGKVWVYVPESHKTEHHERGREIYLGPQAQRIVQEFLKTDLQAYLFSPAEAEAERMAALRQKRKTKVQPSQRDRSKRNAKRKPKGRYTTDSLRRAIRRGIDKVNEDRRQAGEPEIPRWHPNQLRHAAGTKARREAGLETAQVVLGHAKADITQVYAERDRARAMEYMVRFG